MLTDAFLLMGAVFAVLAVRSRRPLLSALWLAGVSAALAIAMYRIGAPVVAVIELSVGAGLVTVLLVFAVNLTGEGFGSRKPAVPRLVALLLAAAPMAMAARLALPLPEAQPAATTTFAQALWNDRGLDVLVQAVLIFAGALGLLGLLAEAEAPLRQPLAREAAAERDRALLTIETAAKQPEGVKV